jgi:cytochrome c-type biogenesis protein
MKTTRGERFPLTLLDGVTLLAFYSLGLGLPLLATPLALDRFLICVKQFRAYLLRLASLTNGACLVASGIMSI